MFRLSISPAAGDFISETHLETSWLFGRNQRIDPDLAKSGIFNGGFTLTSILRSFSVLETCFNQFATIRTPSTGVCGAAKTIKIRVFTGQ